MRNAPQPKFLGGPANRSGHVQVQAQEVLAHESPIMVKSASLAAALGVQNGIYCWLSTPLRCCWCCLLAMGISSASARFYHEVAGV